MAIHIRELVVRAVAEPRSPHPADTARADPAAQHQELLDSLVERCVQQVLETLRKERTR